LPYKFAKVPDDNNSSSCDEDDNWSDESTSKDNRFDVDSGFLSNAHIEQFKELEKESILPSQLEQPTQPFGERKAGKWKANHWYCLFEYIIPLVAIEMFVKDTAQVNQNLKNGLVLVNAGALCRCTSIVCAKRVTPRDPEIFKMYYKRYNNTSKKLFQNINILPNHHYALHTPEQLPRWGPLNQVAEFTGKRLIGFLQKIKTKPNISESSFYLVLDIHCKALRLMAFLYRTTPCNYAAQGIHSSTVEQTIQSA
jgi:hypothetical protein